MIGVSYLDILIKMNKHINKEYINEIDGMRALAVISVVLYHLDSGFLRGGFLGVDVFFVISGYLISGIINKEIKSSNFEFGRFYQRRIARLMPAFILVSCVTLLFASFIYTSQDFASAGANFSAAVLSVANIKYIFQGDYFRISSDAQPFLHCWSLSVEEQFYLIFPGFFALLFKKFHEVTAKKLLSAAVLVSFILYLVFSWISPSLAFFLLPMRAWELGLGCLLAVYYDKKITSEFMAGLISGFSLLVILFSIFFLDEGCVFRSVFVFFVVISSAILIYTTCYSSLITSRLLSTSWFAPFGKMSYSLYLWHWPIFSMIDYRFIAFSSGFRFFLKLMLTVFFSFLTWRFIETPFRVALSGRAVRTRVFLTFGFVVIILVLLGVYVRRENYVDVTPSIISNGGLVELGKNKSGPVVVLLGDSNASMYAMGLRSYCRERCKKIIFLNISGGDVLPIVGGRSQLWEDSFRVIRSTKPDVVIISNNWSAKLRNNSSRLDLALDSISDFAGKVVLITQPPELPDSATRAGFRSGYRPPFFEDPEFGFARRTFNQYVLSKRSDRVVVVNVESLFSLPDGSIKFFDQSGRQIWYDVNHLSNFGADLVIPKISRQL